MALTRRHLLAGAIGVLSLNALQGTLRPASAVASTVLSMTPWATTASVFDEEFTTNFPFSAVKGLSISGSKDTLSNAKVAISYDARGQEWDGTDAAVVSESSIRRIAVAHSVSGTIATLTLTLPPVGTDALDVSLPLRILPLYPHENIGMLQDATAILTPNSMSVPAAEVAFSPQLDTSSGQGWGAEIQVAWGRISSIAGTTGSAYAHPASLQLRSVGPGPVPAGTSIRVVVDANVISSVAPSSVVTRDDGEPSLWHFSPENSSMQSGGLLTLDSLIPANQIVDVILESVATGSPRVTDAITYARVTLIPSAASTGMQRVTQTETAVANTSSGTPLIESSARGKV
ncbi:hypothetical protein GCM10027416_12390 [Okibacterium endophyticum]